jgi:hypothetical protein
MEQLWPLTNELIEFPILSSLIIGLLKGWFVGA